MRKIITIVYILPLLFYSQVQWNQLGQDIDGEAAEDGSGSVVSINYLGNRIGIGAYGNDGGGNMSGHIRVFELNNNVWNQIGQDIDGTINSLLNYHDLDSSGNTLIGAEHSYNNSTGQVKVWSYNGANWIQKGQTLVGNSINSGFGIGVDIDNIGNTIIIGSPNYGPLLNGFGTGEVKVFHYINGTWVQKGSTFSGLNPGDYLGLSVSISGDGNIIAFNRPIPQTPNGEVTVYEFNNGTWVLKGQIINSNSHQGTSFGKKVELSNNGNILAIADNTTSNSKGQVLIYQWSGNSWSQMGQTLNGSNPSDSFGASISLSHNASRIAIGANQYNNYTGLIKIYQWNGTNWSQIGQNLNGEFTNGLPIGGLNILGDFWGTSCKLNSLGDVVIGGAHANDGNGSNAGHARVYELFCPSTSSISQIIACNSYTWIDGVTYTSSNNTATHVLTNSLGCDSIVTLDLTINNSTSFTDVKSACYSYTWIDGNTYTSSNNTATYVLTNTIGCDSVVTLDLIINAINTTITNNSPILIANENGAIYQWINCEGMFAISGEINQSFTATNNGNYAVVVTQNGCTDTSACENVNNVGFDETTLDINIHPNPTKGLINLEIEGYNRSINVEVYDCKGKLLQTNNSNIISLKEYDKGIYLLKISYADIIEEFKIIKE